MSALYISTKFQNSKALLKIFLCQCTEISYFPKLLIYQSI